MPANLRESAGQAACLRNCLRTREKDVAILRHGEIDSQIVYRLESRVVTPDGAEVQIAQKERRPGLGGAQAGDERSIARRNHHGGHRIGESLASRSSLVHSLRIL